MIDNSTNPYRSPVPSAASVGTASSVDSRQRFRLVVAMYLLTAATSVLCVLRPEQQPLIRLLFHVSLASITTYWCVIDSRMRRSPIVRSLHWLIFFTWLIAVPIYLIGSRRLRGLGLVLLHAIGLFVASLLAYHAAGFLAYGQAWLDVLRE